MEERKDHFIIIERTVTTAVADPQFAPNACTAANQMSAQVNTRHVFKAPHRSVRLRHPVVKIKTHARLFLFFINIMCKDVVHVSS